MTIRDKLTLVDRSGLEHIENWGIGSFFFALSFAWLANQSAKSGDKKAVTQALYLLNFFPMMTWFLISNRLTPNFKDINGYPVATARYMEWIMASPLLVRLSADLTKCDESLYNSVSLHNNLCLVFGFLASITREPYSSLFTTISHGVFFPVVVGLYQMFTEPIEGKNKRCKVDHITLRVARDVHIAGQIMVGLPWFLVRYNVISFKTGEIGYLLGELVCKVLFTMVMVNSTIEQSQNERVDVLSDIANQMEQDLSSSDKLLERMMPAEVIAQIKAGKATQAEEYESVTVFFSDITNFAALSQESTVKEMLSTLNSLWVEYDTIAKRWGVYKVETIGDAFLGVVGCPERAQDHAARGVSFAIDVLAMARSFKTPTGQNFLIRIGLNSGPITAGVLGDLNPHWCIVGDTVNTASRMESTSKPMHIHISEATYELARKFGNFDFSAPETMNIKGKGQMVTYWVNGRK